MQEKNTRGGKRAGAGRKPSGRHDVRVRLTPEEHEVFKRLGGSNWLAVKLQDVIACQLAVKLQDVIACQAATRANGRTVQEALDAIRLVNDLEEFPTDVVDDVRILLECQAVEEESH